MFRPTNWSSSGLHQNMSSVAVHVLGSQCVLQLAKFHKLRIAKCNNSLLSVVILIKMRFCSRFLYVVNDGWRVRCLHWVAVVLVGFFAFHALGSVGPHSFSSDLYCTQQFLTFLWLFVVLGGVVSNVKDPTTTPHFN
jgi:predicted ferric reductase